MSLVSPAEAPVQISSAIRKASKATGTDFGYLLTTAARESNFKHQAKAKTSTAAGLFQFIENTWLKTVKEEGARFGLGKYSPHIFRTSSGRYYVPNRSLREEILKLRHDPEVSAMMAGAFTQQNAEYVGARLGRQPTQGELYIAHFLGPEGATRLITLASERPRSRASTHFPRAAEANRGIFYEQGRARSVEQVYDLLVADHAKLKTLTMASLDPKTTSPVELPPAAEKETAPAPIVVAKVADATARNRDGLFTSPSKPAGPPLRVVPRTRVAALDTKRLSLRPDTVSDAGLGSIGPWRTIIERPGEPPAAKEPPGKEVRTEEAKPADEKRRRARSPRSLMRGTRPDAPEMVRHARQHAPGPAAVRVAARIRDTFQSDYWMRIGLSGS